MLITHKNHPVLKKLEEGKMGFTGIVEEDIEIYKNQFNQWAVKKWHENYRAFNRKVRVLSRPFAEALDKAKMKMLTPDLIMQVGPQSGTFVVGHDTYCYNLKDAGNNELDIELFVFGGNTIDLVYEGSYSGNFDYGYVSSRFYRQYTTQHMSAKNQALANLYSCLNFIKYAPIESKSLPANKKIKDFHGKYVNQTGISVDILDSTWFTTLVKSDAFRVRGHFRLQACGEDMKERKLIWINEFQKNGYTAPARKLQEYPE